MREIRIDITLALSDEGIIDTEALRENVRVAMVMARQEGEITPHDEDHAMLEDFGVKLIPQGLETPRMLVLSTSHIRTETDSNFELHTDDVPGTFYPKVAGLGGEQYGWIIPIDPETPWSHMVSADLMAIRQLALSSGCTWIMLDCDAEVVDGLPTYDW